MDQVPTISALLDCLNMYFLPNANGAQILNIEFRRDRPDVAKPAYLSHRFVQYSGNDPAMDEADAALELGSQPETTQDSALRFVAVKD